MKKPTLFLFQWDAKAARQRAKELRSNGWKVRVESEDGARGGKEVLEHPPDIVVFDLANKPSHSRETAHGIRSSKAGRSIAMVFVDGTVEDKAKTAGKVQDARFTSSAQLESTLRAILSTTERV